MAEAALEGVDLVDEQRELVEGGGGASVGDAGLGHPAQEVEAPQGQVRGQQLGQKHALGVGRAGEALPHETLAWRLARLASLAELGTQTQNQRVPPWEGVQIRQLPIPQSWGETT